MTTHHGSGINLSGGDPGRRKGRPVGGMEAPGRVTLLRTLHATAKALYGLEHEDLRPLVQIQSLSDVTAQDLQSALTYLPTWDGFLYMQGHWGLLHFLADSLQGCQDLPAYWLLMASWSAFLASLNPLGQAMVARLRRETWTRLRRAG